ncbi:MAG: hypothetical protein CMH55_01255 [Myxococcales bacterium]|nr:hypothetical protein [Myxococcales bacterium]
MNSVLSLFLVTPILFPSVSTSPVNGSIVVEVVKDEESEKAAPDHRRGGETPRSVEGTSGRFLDTRLTFSWGDDNLFAGPGQTNPNSPRPDFGERQGDEQFFDNLNSRDTGDETRSTLVIHRADLGSHIPRLLTEGALVARFDLYADADTGKQGQLFKDDGSFLGLRYYLRDTGNCTAMQLLARTEGCDLAFAYITAFPFDTNRFRVGYTYDLSWGDPRIFPGRSKAVPGIKLGLRQNRWSLWAGAKSARLLDEEVNEIEARYGYLAGGSLSPAKVVTLQASGGHFDMGTNPNPAVRGQPLATWGYSARAVYHLGTSAGSSADFALMRDNPLHRIGGYRYRQDHSGQSFRVALETSQLIQLLEDPDRAGQLSEQRSVAYALTATVRLGRLYLDGFAFHRDLGFLLRNVPSFVPFQALAGAADGRPERFLAMGAAYALPKSRLTPTLMLGIQDPAQMIGGIPERLRSIGEADLPDAGGRRAVVVRGEGDFDILPLNSAGEVINPVPILAARIALRWDLSKLMQTTFEVNYTHDENQTDLVDGGRGISERVFIDRQLRQRVGVGVITQMRF